MFLINLAITQLIDSYKMMTAYQHYTPTLYFRPNTQKAYVLLNPDTNAHASGPACNYATKKLLNWQQFVSLSLCERVNTNNYLD